MTNKHEHLLFVWDDMKNGFPKQDLIGAGTFIETCMTRKDDYVIWLKNYNRTNNISAVAVETPHNKPEDKRFNRYRPDPGRIRGELHLLPTEVYFELDEVMANGIYFQRQRIQVQLPWSRTEMIKVRGMWIPNEFPNYVEAWAYITPTIVVDNEPWYALKEASKFRPGPRRNNTRYISNKPYYELTRRDLNGQ